VAKIAPRPWESGECRLTSCAQGLHARALALSNPLIRGACFVSVRSAQELSREGLIASGFIITKGMLVLERLVGNIANIYCLAWLAAQTRDQPVSGSETAPCEHSKAPGGHASTEGHAASGRSVGWREANSRISLCSPISTAAPAIK
jgi:hypothetical protein